MAVEMRRVFARAYACSASLDPEEAKKKFQGRNPGFLVQTAKVDMMDNELCYEMLAAQTLSAEAQGSMLAKKPEIDLLLRLAGTTQISRAIKQKGARFGDKFLLIVVGRSDPRKAPGIEARRLTRRELTVPELDRVERAALLNTKRP
jgi:tRNA threonylcarbamoyladenosine modification (KEOPS) complex Cgi121 subunit